MKKGSLSVAAALSTLLLTMSPVTAHAATASSPKTRTYTVKSGDCMYDIARTFHISLRSLEEANPKVHNNLIYVGETLSIPLAASAPTASDRVVTKTTPPSTSTRTYRVKPGDCMYDIARTFHVSLPSLEKANPKVHNNFIYSGEILTIPSKAMPRPMFMAPVQKRPISASQHLTQEVLATAYHLEGIHYLWGGTSPATGFDCSGFIQYIFDVHGIHLPRTASEQSQVGRPVALRNLQPGDLMFFVDTYSHATSQVTHVALYIGNGNVIESSSVGNQGVMVIHNILENPWYRSRYYGARNVIGG